MKKALDRLCNPITYTEVSNGNAHQIETSHSVLQKTIGDVVLARKDIGTSYHLSVVVDDAEQEIDLVTRGQDMADQTPIHRVLQLLLEYPEPYYHHHKLIRDETGKRLAKRDDARTIRKYRAEGYSPQEVKALLRL